MTGKQKRKFWDNPHVLIHDNTYKTNKHDVPLSVFTGLKKYGNSVLLAQVLVSS